jgi:hypothetical protein
MAVPPPEAIRTVPLPEQKKNIINWIFDIFEPVLSCEKKHNI